MNIFLKKILQKVSFSNYRQLFFSGILSLKKLIISKTHKTAIQDGYKNAMSAIIDSNLTTVITGVILFYFGTGPIKGFATTLIIGIITSFFTAVFLTRIFYEAKAEKDGDTIKITVCAKAVSDIKIALNNCVYLENKNKKQELTKVISKFQMSTDYKGMLFGAFIKGDKGIPANISDDFAGPIKEILALD